MEKGSKRIINSSDGFAQGAETQQLQHKTSALFSALFV